MTETGGVAGIAFVVGLVVGGGTVAMWFRHRYERALELSFQDELTGLPNRRAVARFLDHAIGRASRGEDLSLVFFDLDGFKQYNDREGHRRGDEALCRMAGALRAQTRAAEITARYGGDEFIAVLPGEDSGGAREFAERIRATVEELDLPGSGNLTVSAGVATARGGEVSAGRLVELADGALYDAKDRGGNRIAEAPEIEGPSPRGDAATGGARSDAGPGDDARHHFSAAGAGRWRLSPSAGGAGFTLLEVMVAMAVAGLALLALLQVVSTASDGTMRARVHTRALALAEGKMEELVSRPSPSLLAADGLSGRFEEPFERFRYRVRVRRLADPQLAELDVRVTEGEAGGGSTRLTTRVLVRGFETVP